MDKLLVVDDNEQNRYMAEVLLGNSGYRVEVAINGSEALEKAREDPPDLILSDILMPVMDGFALCREWRLDDQLKSIPFIFYTATYTDSEDEHFGLSLGADRFLVKPIATETLISTIREVLDQSQTAPVSLSKYEIADDQVYLKKYNQTLIHKLEDKLDQLETSNRRLENQIRESNRNKNEVQCLERQLVQSQKMEAIGTLAGGIAHDFNNILMAIMGLTDMASIYQRDGRSNEIQLQAITKACTRAKELVAQILTFSRQNDIQQSPVQLKSVVEEVLKMLRPSLPASIDIKHSLASNALIKANPTRIHQVLMNLCTNAYQAIQDDGGTIEILLEESNLDSIVAHGVAPGKYINLEVRDTGIGMTADQLDHIFEPYYTTKHKSEGTGLGLSVVHGIVTECGGNIIAQSEINKGSTFSVFFPVLESSTADDLHSPELPFGGDERIMIIDDERAVIETSSEYLNALGYEVTAFQDSMEAFEHFKSIPDAIDLVVTDMTMPGLNGDKLTGMLLEIRPDLPIILCTGYSEKISKEKSEELGLKAFLMKPFELRRLSKVIRQAIDQSPTSNRVAEAKDRADSIAKVVRFRQTNR